LLRRVDRAAELASSGPAGVDPEVVDLGPLTIDQVRREVTVNGGRVHLTRTEFDLLVRLAGAPGAVLTRERLLAEVWDWPGASGTRTVDSHVRSLRSKVGADLIRTVHGVGYALQVP